MTLSCLSFVSIATYNCKILPLDCLTCFFFSPLAFSFSVLFSFPYIHSPEKGGGEQMRHKTEKIRRGSGQRGESQKIVGESGREIIRMGGSEEERKCHKQERKKSQNG